HDGARPDDAHDLPRRHRLRTSTRGIEGAAKARGWDVSSARLHDEMSRSMHGVKVARGCLRLCVAVFLVTVALGGPASAQPAAGPPLSLQDALARARANSQQFRQAQLAADLATEDRKQARAALLPSMNGFSQFIYTEPNGTPSGIWVPNDGPKVYATWLNVHGDVFSIGKWSEYRSAAA